MTDLEIGDERSYLDEVCFYHQALHKQPNLLWLGVIIWDTF